MSGSLRTINYSWELFRSNHLLTNCPDANLGGQQTWEPTSDSLTYFSPCGLIWLQTTAATASTTYGHGLGRCYIVPEHLLQLVCQWRRLRLGGHTLHPESEQAATKMSMQPPSSNTGALLDWFWQKNMRVEGPLEQFQIDLVYVNKSWFKIGRGVRI
jgi:hypothetical protein